MTIRSWNDVEHLTDELAWMGAWRDVLEWKINSPHRHFEPAHLEAELKSYRRECAALAAFEGQSGVRQRIEAYRQRHIAEAAEGIPFFLESVTLDLIKEHPDLIAAIQASAVKPVAVVLDTLNRSLNGSESSDEDMGAYVRAADAIRETLDIRRGTVLPRYRLAQL